MMQHQFPLLTTTTAAAGEESERQQQQQQERAAGRLAKVVYIWIIVGSLVMLGIDMLLIFSGHSPIPTDSNIKAAVNMLAKTIPQALAINSTTEGQI